MLIGLLGGSFDPAHEGHFMISQYAINYLGLDQIWWVVARQNPFKQHMQVSCFQERLNSAMKLIKGSHRIKICNVEERLRFKYSIDTIHILKKSYPKYKFFWMIGLDNVMEFHKWHKWLDIVDNIPIVVFNRECNARIVKSRFSLSNKRLFSKRDLIYNDRGYMYIHKSMSVASSTEIRGRTNVMEFNIEEFLEQSAAQEIRSIKLCTSLFAKMIIVTARSGAHVKALAEKLRVEVKKYDFVPSVSCPINDYWMVVDYHDVRVNIMSDASRKEYDIDSLWYEV